MDVLRPRVPTAHPLQLETEPTVSLVNRPHVPVSTNQNRGPFRKADFEKFYALKFYQIYDIFWLIFEIFGFEIFVGSVFMFEHMF